LALIKSISGTRGTIGGKVGENFTAQDIVQSTAAYAQWLLQAGQRPTVVVGRDARISGSLVSELVGSTLRMMGISVLDLGLSTTPTVEIAVQQEAAGGGIIITASHNPQEWNALKFLNSTGEFISDSDGKEILRLANSDEIVYATIDKIGSNNKLVGYIQKHINLILGLDLVRHASIQHRKFKIVVDCINSTGALSIVPLLEQLGCEVIAINDAANGRFAHNPEPLPQHLTELAQEVVKQKADLGVAVDPDVDRLAIVCEDGEMFGEEYTLVAVADYVLKHHKGNTVSNLSSTQALQKITEKHGGVHYASAVGEVNVVRKMKEVQAVIGGEGNGGVIYPVLHYGRDAMVGIALFLSSLVEYNKTVSRLRQSLPHYVMVKDKIQLQPNINIDTLLAQLTNKYKNYPQNTEDGLKIFVDDNWLHLRSSNTEPIIRIYAESNFEVTALNLINKIKSDIKAFLSNDEA
jgi:phosphomannomutase